MILNLPSLELPRMYFLTYLYTHPVSILIVHLGDYGNYVSIYLFRWARKLQVNLDSSSPFAHKTNTLLITYQYLSIAKDVFIDQRCNIY